jgi:hypothetical protein
MWKDEDWSRKLAFKALRLNAEGNEAINENAFKSSNVEQIR